MAETVKLPDPVAVVKAPKSGLRLEIETGKHHIIADEMPAIGGTDMGPSPTQYLLSSLGACTAMTLRIYSERKKWPLLDVDVKLKYSKVPADAADPTKGQVDHILREIRLTGALDDEMKTRLMEVANKCPVHKMLSPGVRIETKAL
ncbi:MAG: OsmC family protein [Planctomycetes bacterium]|nr:OsmC family protein [Planctomycetota bacterium]